MVPIGDIKKTTTLTSMVRWCKPIFVRPLIATSTVLEIIVQLRTVMPRFYTIFRLYREKFVGGNQDMGRALGTEDKYIDSLHAGKFCMFLLSVYFFNPCFGQNMKKVSNKECMRSLERSL